MILCDKSTQKATFWQVSCFSPFSICFLISALNKVCSTPENCWHIDNSNCTNDQCVCNEGFVQSYDNKSCLKISISQTDYCELDEQCTDYFGPSAYCAESKCKCKDKFHLDPKSLRCIKNIGKKLIKICSPYPVIPRKKYDPKQANSSLSPRN